MSALLERYAEIELQIMNLQHEKQQLEKEMLDELANGGELQGAGMLAYRKQGRKSVNYELCVKESGLPDDKIQSAIVANSKPKITVSWAGVAKDLRLVTRDYEEYAPDVLKIEMID